MKIAFEPTWDTTSGPEYQTEGASGFDFHADIGSPLDVGPGVRAIIPTGVHVEVPSFFELQVRPRSGLALKRGITVVNSPGTVDSDFRGELKIILLNTGGKIWTIQPNDRVAQGVICPIARFPLEFVGRDQLSETKRGLKGYGSTGS